MKVKNTITNWYQNGFVHRLLTLVVFLAVVATAVFIMEVLYGSLAFSNLGVILEKYVGDSSKIALVMQDLGSQQRGKSFIAFMCFGAVLFTSIWALRKFAQLNIVGEVTLDRAVRFNEAMERLGLLRGAEQIFFLRSNKLQLYITDQALADSEAEHVKARPYIYAHNVLSSQGIIERQSGQRRLCVKADELQTAIDHLYASLKLDAEPSDDVETVKALQKKVMELEAERRATNRQLMDNSSEINELKAENKRFANANKGEEMREGKKKRSEQELALYAMIFAPAYRKLSEGKHDPKDFTRAAFEKFFAHELRATDRLHEQLKRVTGKEIFNKVPSNVFDAIWNNLKDFGLVNLGGAAPSGSLERLEELFYPNTRR